jgi:F-type H+-transporting ATPase subunit gamma
MSLRRAATSLVQRLSGVAEEANVFLGAKSFALEGAVGADSVRHASNQAVKMRIRAIKNIGKITKAMKMVAASKMRAAQVAVDNSRGIVDPFYRLFGDYPGAWKTTSSTSRILP